MTSDHRRLDFRFWSRPRLPVLLQTEAAECGLACLAMVAGYWGFRTDLPAMRRRFSVSLRGATLRSLMNFSQALSLKARPLKLGLEDLDKLSLPCVLHWDMNHFVVLRQVRFDGVLVHDPAVGERRLRMEEVSLHFTGVALELTPAAGFTPARDKLEFTVRSLMGHVVGLRRGLAQLVLIGLALQVCALVAPFYLQWIVDEALLSADRDLVRVLGMGFLLLVAVQTLMSAVRSWATTALSTNLNFQWFGNVFEHLMRLPLPYFERRHLGDIVSRFGSVQAIQRSLTTQFVEGALDGVLSVGTLIVMLFYSPLLTGVAITAVALYVVSRVLLFNRLREANSEQIIHASRQQTHFMESARGVQSIRLFNRTEERRLGWMNALADQFNSDLRISRLTITGQALNGLLFNGERVLVIWLAALAVLDGRFSAGMLFAFMSYKDQFSQRAASLVDKLFDLRMLRLHGQRLADIVLTQAEADVVVAETDADTIAPTIELRNVSFRYADSEPWILREVHLRVEEGQCVAIAGASGCGKTTLLKIMLGLLEPSEGEVLVGGHPIGRLGLSNYRALAGTVMQDDHLFSGSIADNIGFFDQQLDMARVHHGARLAAIHSEIESLPMGYNTLVGDLGSGLSGGQKQRILLARALYKAPRMLFLDEATSHLDVWNEQLVNAAIKEIELTRVIVAHRPETIAMAQRVVVLEKGMIVRDLEQRSAGGIATAALGETV